KAACGKLLTEAEHGTPKPIMKIHSQLARLPLIPPIISCSMWAQGKETSLVTATTATVFSKPQMAETHGPCQAKKHSRGQDSPALLSTLQPPTQFLPRQPLAFTVAWMAARTGRR